MFTRIYDLASTATANLSNGRLVSWMFAVLGFALLLRHLNPSH